MRISSGNPVLNGPFAALSPNPPTITPTPLTAGFVEAPPAPPPPPPQGAPTGGLLGGLFGSSPSPGGLLGDNGTEGGASGRGGLLGLGGNLGGLLDIDDPKTLIALQFLVNGSRPPAEMLGGIGNIQKYAHDRQREKEEKAEAAAQKNATLEYLRSNRPDLLPMAEAGYLKEAFSEAMKKPDVKRQWVELDDGSYGWANETTGELEKLGTASKPTDYQVREQELIRRGIDPNSPSGQGYILTGKYAGPGGDVEGVGLKTELEASKAYRTEDDVKVYRDIRNAYQRVRASATLGNAQGDIGLVYGFMKMLDPTSVVREGEFATAQNSGGVEESVRNTYNKILSGERLTPEQRQQFAGAAEQYYNRAAENLAGTNQRYEPMLDQYGVPKERVIEQPMKFEPLKIGEAREVDVNGVPVTIKKRGE